MPPFELFLRFFIITMINVLLSLLAVPFFTRSEVIPLCIWNIICIDSLILLIKRIWDQCTIELFWVFPFQMKYCVGNMTWYFRKESLSLRNDTAIGLWVFTLWSTYIVPHTSKYPFAHILHIPTPYHYKFHSKLLASKKSWVCVAYS